MKYFSLFKLYWKHNYKSHIIFICLLGIYYYFLPRIATPAVLLLYLVNMIQSVYQFGDRLKRIEQLKAKGLTEKDVFNIEFVQRWGETRSYGIWRYCIRDGGIIAGAGLSLALSVLFACFNSTLLMKIWSEPSGMFGFIGCAYLGGIIIGI
ncbi:MAG: hypothetical protein JST32_10930, partial [Bacteroidetes bacterium]|nr:hypothetical protein [Bacteroidota bacterium]